MSTFLFQLVYGRIERTSRVTSTRLQLSCVEEHILDLALFHQSLLPAWLCNDFRARPKVSRFKETSKASQNGLIARLEHEVNTHSIGQG